MKILAIRHGETSYKQLGLCNDDSTVDVDLTNTGIEQAEALAEQLQNYSIDRVFTSELPRARQTAGIINRYHDASLESDARLNDIRTGFEGQPVPDYFAATAHDPLHARIKGGESLLDYKARGSGFIHWLVEQPFQQVTVVAHEETLRVFAAWFKGVEDAALRALHFPNCSVTEYRS
jgi:alpha-ribazole phosphatase